MQGGVSEIGKGEAEKLSYSKRKRELGWSAHLMNKATNSICIWFSPWQHQNAENPLVALLLEIRDQYSAWVKVKSKARKINRQGGLAGLALLERTVDAALSLSMGKGMKIASGTSKAVREAWEENEEKLDKLSDGQRFQLLFQDAVKTALKGVEDKRVDGRLIIFIDDLDRCDEETVVRMLEAIKLYLGTDRCVFVLGMDDSAILTAMQKYWGRGEDFNRDYLDKLLQASLAVPQPREQQLSEMIKNQLLLHEFPDETIEQEDILKLLEPNPRKVKNFLNSLCANWSLLKSAELKKPGNAQRFIMFQYLRLHHRPVWRILERQPKALGLLHQTLNRTPSTEKKDPLKGLDSEQRVMQKVFEQAFSHVLPHYADDKDNAKPNEYELRHGFQNLETVVEQFLERIDRKKSDDYFAKWFIENLDNNDELDSIFLSIKGSTL